MIHRIAALAIVLLLAPFLAPAQDGPPTYLLINNATVWDGTSDIATPGMNVLVENNLVKQISAEPIAVNRSAISGHNDLALLTEDPLNDIFSIRGDSSVGQDR